jgi:cobalt-zinc-cadmium efflux system outer membrane protein
MIFMRTLTVGVTAVALAASAYAQDRADAGPLLTLEEAVTLASGDQPALIAYEREAVASEQAAIAARTLPDPQISAGIDNFPVIRGRNAFNPIEDEMTMYSIGVMREQVRRSKREAEAGRILAEALVSRRQASAQERQIRRSVMIAWIDAVEARSKETLFKRLVDDLKTGRKVMEAGVSTGGSTPALVLQMDAEIALAEGQHAEAGSVEDRARAELGRWIGTAASRPLPDALPTIEAPANVPAQMLRIAAHPSVQAAEAEQQVALKRVDVARQERKPDISWSVSLGIRPKYGEMVSAGVSIPLQLNRRQRQDRLVGEAQARADAASLRIEDTRRELERQYRVALADYRGADAQLMRINREAIPALETSFKVAEARYAGGGGTLDQPFAIVRRYVEVSIMSVEARAKRDRSVAEMLYVIGETGR